MNKQYNKKLISFILLAIFIISIVVLLIFVKPEEIVNKIGVNNSYILIFIVSFFGGFSAGGTFSFISVLITLAIGGLNPIYLGLISGLSLTIGDIIMFHFGSKGRELVNYKWDARINKISKVINKREWVKKILPFVVYLYIGFAPLPNDFLILLLAAIKYPRKKMNIILALGDFSFALTVAILASQGIKVIN